MVIGFLEALRSYKVIKIAPVRKMRFPRYVVFTTTGEVEIKERKNFVEIYVKNGCVRFEGYKEVCFRTQFYKRNKEIERDDVKSRGLRKGGGGKVIRKEKQKLRLKFSKIPSVNKKTNFIEEVDYKVEFLTNSSHTAHPRIIIEKVKGYSVFNWWLLVCTAFLCASVIGLRKIFLKTNLF